MQKLFTSDKIREWDKFTIQNEPIASFDLMQRAATEFYKKLTELFPFQKKYFIVCGIGNNGGDGLVVAGLLKDSSYDVKICIVKSSSDYSDDFKFHFKNLNEKNIEILYCENTKNFPIESDVIIIDAIFGTGIKGSVKGEASEIIQYINSLENTVVSVDLPSGLSADFQHILPDKKYIVHANYTITFQQPKLTMFLPDSGNFCGEIFTVDIGLSEKFYHENKSNFYLIEKNDIAKLIKPRKKFSYKNIYGHALLVCGSTGMAGAAILSAKSCMRTGVGLVTCNVEENINDIIQIAVPEAITSTEKNIDLKKYNAVGLGSGLGKNYDALKKVKYILTWVKKNLLLDADAINIIAENHFSIPENTVITPHTGEFDRLAKRDFATSFERLQEQISFSETKNLYVILKGAYTSVSTPDGKIYFNPTGNAGMATAGSGDVLTGIITSLLAQGYTPEQACVIGVYLHGLAGDFAAKKYGEPSLIAGDIVENISAAYMDINKFVKK